MKQVLVWFICLLTIGVTACSDSDEKNGLQLSATRDKILANGSDEVYFTVTTGGTDVTSAAVIKEQTSGEVQTAGEAQVPTEEQDLDDANFQEEEDPEQEEGMGGMSM